MVLTKPDRHSILHTPSEKQTSNKVCRRGAGNRKFGEKGAFLGNKRKGPFYATMTRLAAASLKEASSG
jgi:hypothetical protein